MLNSAVLNSAVLNSAKRRVPLSPSPGEHTTAEQQNGALAAAVASGVREAARALKLLRGEAPEVGDEAAMDIAALMKKPKAEKKVVDKQAKDKKDKGTTKKDKTVGVPMAHGSRRPCQRPSCMQWMQGCAMPRL